MNETQIATTSPGQIQAAREFNIVELLIVMAKHKTLIIGMPLVVGLAATAISFALPNVYKATTKLLPPQQAQSGAAALLSQLGSTAGVVAGAAGLKSPNDLYIGMLKSRTVADSLIETYKLKKVYDVDSQDRARKTLESNTTIAAGKDGLITIDVEDEDIKLVAPLANGYVNELMKLTRVLAVTEASQRRMFFERQLELSKDRLAQAEMTLKGALDTGGVISVDSDSRAIVETVGRVRAQISAKEIELASIRASLTPSNPEYRRIEHELSSLRAELSKLENGRPHSAGGLEEGGRNQRGLENIKMLRDVKYYQMLYELLVKQYEAARLDEAKDSSIIQVLDPALEPERKFKPKRSIIVVLSFFSALVLAVLMAFFFEAKQRALRTPDGLAQWERLKFHFWGR